MILYRLFDALWFNADVSLRGGSAAMLKEPLHQCDVSDWTGIVAVRAGRYHTVGLKSDGTVVAVGLDFMGRCNVGNWTDIVAISAGSLHTVGLKADGTVVAVGSNGYGQCNVGAWKDIRLPN